MKLQQFFLELPHYISIKQPFLFLTLCSADHLFPSMYTIVSTWIHGTKSRPKQAFLGEPARTRLHDAYIPVQLIMMESLNWTEACVIDSGLVRRWSPIFERWSPIFENHTATANRNGDNLRFQERCPFHESQHENCMPTHYESLSQL